MIATVMHANDTIHVASRKGLVRLTFIRFAKNKSSNATVNTSATNDYFGRRKAKSPLSAY
nr:hypothetical protein [Massilia sp. PDC64]